MAQDSDADLAESATVELAEARRRLMRGAVVALALACASWFCNPGGAGTVVALGACAFVFSEFSRGRRELELAPIRRTVTAALAVAALSAVVALAPVAGGLTRVALSLTGLR